MLHSTYHHKERKEFMQEADRIIERLANVLVEEGDKECSLPFLLYVTAKFTAGLLLGLQEEGNQVDIADEYTKFRKECKDILLDIHTITTIEIRANLLYWDFNPNGRRFPIFEGGLW